ncbi:hypothetical protein GCM10014713_03260 [Streptomyces purpureus]|uniref:Uncharacterized protein n=1 Tax=Streptomyces purpureus TaxID=1951 RepID=A0A918GXT5_9ACTN|nr:hypothetical protein GCM10014713_03260 [Streptomyces purpureus]
MDQSLFDGPGQSVRGDVRWYADEVGRAVRARPEQTGPGQARRHGAGHAAPAERGAVDLDSLGAQVRGAEGALGAGG